MNKPNRNNNPHFYIMKAHHLFTSSYTKLSLKKVIEGEPDSTVLIAKRTYGWNDKEVECYIIGAPSSTGYGVKSGDRCKYTIDTGNGYKDENNLLEIINVLQVKDGVVVFSDAPLEKKEPSRSGWVMK